MSRSGLVRHLLTLAVVGGVIVGLSAETARAQPAPYTVAITGVDDGTLRPLLEATSSLVQLQDGPAPSLIGLRHRADGDRERLEAALHSEGYYDAHLNITVSPHGTAASASPSPSPSPTAVVTLAVTTGPLYHLRHVAIIGTALPPGLPNAEALGLAPGTTARGPLVVQAEQKLRDRLGDQGFAFAKVIDRRAEIDRDAQVLDVTFTVAPGPVVRLGAVHVVGLERVDEQVVRERAAWVTGELYRPELIERTRTALTKLGVFSTLSSHLADRPDSDGTTAVTITVTERKRHTIGMGVTFTNAEGLGADASWSHRNLFGGGEQLRLGAELNRLNIRTLTPAGLDQADEKLTADLRKPGFLAADQDLTLSTAAINEHPDAYQRQALTAGAHLEWRLPYHLTLGYGLSGEQSDIRDTAGFTMDTLVGAPLSLAYDTTDALLDPTTGYRVALEATPWLRMGDTGDSFVINRLTQSLYQDLSGEGDWVAAGRLSLGTILTSNPTNLPADKRFYAGGGGSVRGYAYQAIGPLDSAGHPLGGQSLAEASAEMRIKITETLGVVPFIDGGDVYSALLPQPSQAFRFGTGLGVRYYSAVGPLRLDVGAPLRPSRTDQPIQVYLSMGQAF